MSIERKLPPLHPGQILYEDILESPYDAKSFAEKADLSYDLVDGILNGDYRISASVAKKISKIIGGTEEFWLNLQSEWEEWNFNNGTTHR